MNYEIQSDGKMRDYHRRLNFIRNSRFPHFFAQVGASHTILGVKTNSITNN